MRPTVLLLQKATRPCAASSAAQLGSFALDDFAVDAADRVPSAGNGKWKTTKQPRLSKESFLELLQGQIPAICEPQFISRDTCKQFEDLIAPRLTPYSHIAGPRVDKVGVAQFEFQAQSAEDFRNRGTESQDKYFSKVEELKGLHDDISRVTGNNPSSRILALVADLFPEWDVSIARERDGRRYHSGIYRTINDSTPIHCDWSPYDSATEDWIINKIICQTVFNLYMAPVPANSGETTVYDRQWTPQTLEHRDPATYGYFRQAVDGASSVAVRPLPGDLVFFNTRNLHEVGAVATEMHPVFGEWKRPRLALSSFMGLLPAGVLSDRPSLIFWS